MASFLDVVREVQNNRFPEIAFAEHEMVCYREFADELQGHITKLGNGAKYVDDIYRILTTLDEVYRCAPSLCSR
jgi:hypothetical protein